jgi:hypothetical protein
MPEYATLYLIKKKDKPIKDSYLLTVKEGRKLLTVRNYRYSRKKFNILFNEVDDYELLLYKKIQYGSKYELHRIEEYYKKKLEII